MNFSGFVRAFFLWTSIAFSTILCASLVLICFPFAYIFDKKRNSLHVFGNVWAQMIKTLNPWWKFKFVGLGNLPPKDKAVIYVANHQSQADIIALFMLNIPFRWIAKDSLFKIPFLGWAMHAIGYVPVIRGNRVSQEKCLRLSEDHLKRGVPMAFFPEGTRSLTGQLGDFKSGAFRLAKISGVPIVPITIDGCATLLPKHSFIPQRATVTITVHPPIDSTHDEVKTLMEKARQAIASKL